jgi:hypothetical protein
VPPRCVMSAKSIQLKSKPHLLQLLWRTGAGQQRACTLRQVQHRQHTPCPASATMQRLFKGLVGDRACGGE